MIYEAQNCEILVTFFEKIYKKKEDWINKKKLEYVLRHIHGENKRILDIGIGTGYLLMRCYKKGMECYGFDLPRDDLKKIRRKIKSFGIKIFTGKINRLPFPDCFFDFVTMINILEYLKMWEINIILSEANRVLKNGGKLLIIVPFEKKSETINVCPYCLKVFNLRFQDFSQKSLEKIVVRHKFRIVSNKRIFSCIDKFKVLKNFSPTIVQFFSQFFILLGLAQPLQIMVIAEKIRG